jgi:hypothetical protein
MLFRKIIAGNDDRISRLHDEKSILVSADRILRNGPKAVMSGIMRKFFNHRPNLPWISYDAISFIDKYLNNNSVLLEYGSGMSTFWYAQHAGTVYSVEDNLEWFENVNSILKKAILDYKVIYEYKQGADYSGFMNAGSVRFDMIMIDGSDRAACAANAINLVKNGGVIYLDNSDKHSSPSGGDTRIAENILLDFASKKGASVRYFTDFCPCEFFVQQGMLVQLVECGSLTTTCGRIDGK